MIPRLKQSIVNVPTHPDVLNQTTYEMLRAYDCIWNMLYEPLEYSHEERVQQAKSILCSLGFLLETAMTEHIFDESYKQLELDGLDL